MNIVLFAATGRAGRCILDELVRRGHAVTAVVRNPARLPAALPPGVQMVQDDFRAPLKTRF